MKNKIPAFTVMEFTIAMILTSIIIGAGYQAWGLMSGQSHRSGMKNEALAHITSLDYLLKRDFLESKFIFWMEDELKCTKEKTEIFYRFQDDMIIRKEHASDTFKIAHLSHEGFLHHESIQSGLLEVFKITLKHKDMILPFSYKKNYSIAELQNIPQNIEY